MSGTGKSSEAGFTLVEITVVMLIIGVFALSVLPRLSDLAGLRIDRDARRIGRAVGYLYAQAAAHGRVVRLYFDLETGEYYPAILNDGGEFEKTTFPLFSGAKLGGTVYVRSVKTAFSGVFKGETAHLTFMPEGFAESAIIVLADRHGNARSLAVESLTGKTRVAKGAVEAATAGGGA